MSPLRPGASEVFRVIVPCELVDGNHHEIRLRLKINNNRVTFEGACDWRTAQAVEKLSDLMTCRESIDKLKDSIRTKIGIDVQRCKPCDVLIARLLVCPLCRQRAFQIVPAWRRIQLYGRVS